MAETTKAHVGPAGAGRMSAAGVVEHARKRAERKAEGLRVLEELLKEAQLHMTQDEESALWSLFSSGLDW